MSSKVERADVLHEIKNAGPQKLRDVSVVHVRFGWIDCETFLPLTGLCKKSRIHTSRRLCSFIMRPIVVLDCAHPLGHHLSIAGWLVLMGALAGHVGTTDFRDRGRTSTNEGLLRDLAWL